jgi:phosphatidylinositol glycan class O
MAAKLTQLDGVIARTAAALAADASHAGTLLLVLGDHGMTWAGDHGGGSEEETHSALFALRPGAARAGQNEQRQSSNIRKEGSLPQIDFAPSLALLLGVPPPYGSVGRVSRALWAAAGGGGGGFAAARRGNAWQVARALRAYAAAGSFAPADVAAVQALYATCADATDAESAASAEDAFLSAAAALARAQWTSFRAAPMAAGLAVLLAALGAHAAALLAALPPADGVTADAWAPMAVAAAAIGAEHTACVFSVGAMQLEAAAAHVPMGAFAAVHAALCAWRVLWTPAKARAPACARLTEACALLLVTAAIAAAAMPGEDKPADAAAADAAAGAAAAQWLHPAALTTAARTYAPLLLLPAALLPRRDARSAAHTLLAAAVWACHAAVGVHWAAAAAVTAGASLPASVAHAARIGLPRAVYAGGAVAACAALRTARSSGGGDASRTAAAAAAAASRGVLAALSAPLLLLTGRAAPLLAALAAAQGALLLRAHAHPPTPLRRCALLSAACASHFTALQLFSATGHRSAFEALHFKAAFTGFDDFGFARQGVLLAANTWAAELAAAAALPLVAARLAGDADDGAADDAAAFWRSLRALLAARGLLRAAGAGAAAAAAAVLRRHLHVWALFAPKFVFEAAALLLTDALALAAVAVAAAGAGAAARHTRKTHAA